MNFFSKRKFYEKIFMQPPNFFFRCSKHQNLNLHEGFIVLRAIHTQWHVVKDAMCHFGPPPTLFRVKREKQQCSLVRNDSKTVVFFMKKNGRFLNEDSVIQQCYQILCPKNIS